MAYMDQEQKAKINTELKKVMPKSWKWSLSVKHHSAIVLTIQSGPKELAQCFREGDTYRQVNEFYLETQFSGKALETMEKIKKALNLDNFDKSDVQSDYFHVGHYTDINIGRWNKPYQII